MAESFLPDINGVTNTCLRVIHHLKSMGHEVLVIAPGTGDVGEVEGVPVEYVPSVPFGINASVNFGIPTHKVTGVLMAYKPDVVHLAAPFFLGAAALRAARRLRLPTVAIFQTDYAGFASSYHLTGISKLVWKWVRTVHNKANLTLAPSRPVISELRAQGVGNVQHWGRGVDTRQFHPGRRSDTMRAELCPGGERIIGFVGRLAPEKQVHLLAHLADLPNTKLVIVGDGPTRKTLEEQLPSALFRGFRAGEDLATHVASFDVFVHTGIDETFCQTIQEAMASGVAVVGPRAGGPIDLICHGRTGYLYDVGDYEGMRKRVMDIIDTPGRAVAMGEAAVCAVAGRTWSALGEQLLDHYRSVLPGPTPGRRRSAA